MREKTRKKVSGVAKTICLYASRHLCLSLKAERAFVVADRCWSTFPAAGPTTQGAPSSCLYRRLAQRSVESVLLEQPTPIELLAHRQQIRHAHLVLGAVPAERENRIGVRMAEPQVFPFHNAFPKARIEQQRPQPGERHIARNQGATPLGTWRRWRSWPWRAFAAHAGPTRSPGG